ncbi:MAG TPA: LysR family transcriptional regulator [Acetobacteraceae bacterium]|nr:LysR family transcriptional regulator [Acetobacteraceae bacterium]
MELHEIRYFLALCRTLNFTRAADECHVSQPALTRAIRKMEDELGGPLFCRERNNTHLTQLGRMIEPHLAATLARAEAAKQAASHFLRLDKASLRLGTARCIGPARFVDLLTRFRATHPGVEIALMQEEPGRLCALLEKGDVDAALVPRPDPLPAALQMHLLYCERFVVACAPAHPLVRRNAVRVADLDGQTYLSHAGCNDRDVPAEVCAASGARLACVIRSERLDWILAMVAAGVGVCFLPEDSGVVPDVAIRPLIDPPIMRGVCLATIAGRPWSAPLAAFVRAIRHCRWPEAEQRAA